MFFQKIIHVIHLLVYHVQHTVRDTKYFHWRPKMWFKVTIFSVFSPMRLHKILVNLGCLMNKLDFWPEYWFSRSINCFLRGISSEHDLQFPWRCTRFRTMGSRSKNAESKTLLEFASSWCLVVISRILQSFAAFLSKIFNQIITQSAKQK